MIVLLVFALCATTVDAKLFALATDSLGMPGNQVFGTLDARTGRLASIASVPANDSILTDCFVTTHDEGIFATLALNGQSCLYGVRLVDGSRTRQRCWSDLVVVSCACRACFGFADVGDFD